MKVRKILMISVIMPVYNVEKYVSSCIKSVLDQTYKNFELIVINDGSTDNSLQEVMQFKYDPRVKIYSQKNQGLSAARNTGLKYAKGDYIYFLDSDDQLNVNFFGLVINEFENKSNTDLISFDYEKLIDNKQKYRSLSLKNRQYLKREEALIELVLHKIREMAWSYVVRANIIMDNKIEFSYGRLFEDNNSTPKIFSKCRSIEKITFSSAPYLLREREDSITKIASKKHSIKEMDDEVFVFTDEYNVIRKNLKKADDKIIVDSWYFNTINHIYIKYYKSLIKDNRAIFNELREKSIKLHNSCNLDLSFNEQVIALFVRYRILGKVIPPLITLRRKAYEKRGK